MNSFQQFVRSNAFQNRDRVLAKSGCLVLNTGMAKTANSENPEVGREERLPVESCLGPGVVEAASLIRSILLNLPETL